MLQFDRIILKCFSIKRDFITPSQIFKKTHAIALQTFMVSGMVCANVNSLMRD